MDKVIKVIKENEYTYQLSYQLYDNKIYPKIRIFKNNKLFSGGTWDVIAESFYFNASIFSSNSKGKTITMKEMFNKLREYIDIPEYIEREFESLFIMYKLNDFNES